MKFIRSVIFLFSFLLGVIPALRAQFVVTYPGLYGTDSTVGIYNLATDQSVNSFSSLPSNPAPSPGATGAFKVLSNATGSLHFYIANTAGPAATFTGTFYRSASRFGNFTTPVTSALITPDSNYLVIGESTVHFFAVAPFSNGISTDLTPGGLAIPNATNVLDLAVDYDSQTVYVLATDGTSTYVATISLAPLLLGEVPTVGTTIPAPAGSTFLTFAPNGLLYISSPQAITEINPVSLAVTPSGTISITINPGRPVFTPGGQYLVAADPAPVAGGSAVALVDLFAHTLAGTLPYNGLGDPISELFAISDTTIYALIPGTTTLWDLQIGSNGGLIATVPPFATNLANAGSAINIVSAFVASDNVGAPGRNAPQYLFLADTSFNLFVIDPVSFAILNQFVLVDGFSPPGELYYFIPSAGVAAINTLEYNGTQTVPLGGTTLPIVIRTVDANGYPSAGNPVTFYLSVEADGVSFNGTLSPAMPSDYPGQATVYTGIDGYAEVFYTAGALSTDVGVVPVNSTAQGAAATITVGTAASVAPASLTIVSGQGQVVFQNPNTPPGTTPAPLVVIAEDSSGNPLPNVEVTFAQLSLDPNVSPGPTSTVLTNTLGEASPAFQVYGAYAPPFPNYATELVTATSGTLSTTFYVNTIANVAAPPTGCLTPLPCPTVVPELTLKVVKPGTGTVFSGGAGSTITGAIQVVLGSLPNAVPIPNIGISVNTGTSTTVANARCSEPTGSGIILTDSNGVANCDLILNSIPGTEPLSIYVGGTPFVPGFASITISPNPAATITVVSGDNQYGDAGTTLTAPFTIQALDSSGNPIPSTPVTWQVTSGSIASFNQVTTVTDLTGSATATAVLGATAGVATVTATAGSVSATFTVNVVTPPADIVEVSGDQQTVQSNAAVPSPFVVQVLDADGNPAVFAGVTFSLSGAPLAAIAGAPIGATSFTVTTDSNGEASISVTAGSPGLVTVFAQTTDGVASATFSLTVLGPAPSSIQVFNAASYTTAISPGALISLAGATLTPTIQGVISDAASIQESGYTVTIGDYNALILALINVNGIQQINVQVPFEVIPGIESMTVQTPQGSSTTNITVASFAPGIFTSGTVSVSGSTFPQAVALRSDGSYVSAANPAQAGELITFFATGLGQTTPPASDGSTGLPGQTVYAPLFVAVNHLSVTVASAVYQVGSEGVYAITIQIPPTTTIGQGQPLSLFVQDSSGVGYNAADAYIPISQPANP